MCDKIGGPDLGSNTTANVQARRQRVLRYYLRGLTSDEVAAVFQREGRASYADSAEVHENDQLTRLGLKVMLFIFSKEKDQ